jgi:hypothetical protein
MVIVIGGCVLLLVCLFFIVRPCSAISVPKHAHDYACELFELNPNRTRFLNLDLAGVKGKPYIMNHVVGVPDCVCKTKWRDTRVILVGEVKGRKAYNRPRNYEIYQLQMYMAMVAKKHRTKVVGVLAYKDGIIEVAFDQRIVDDMMMKRSECRSFINKIQ